MPSETTSELIPITPSQGRETIAKVLVVLSWLCLLAGAGLSVPTYIEGLADPTPSWDYQFWLGYAGGGAGIAIILSLIAWPIAGGRRWLWTVVASVILLAVTGVAWWLLPEPPGLFSGGIPTIDLSW
jgi:hypothetical protein